MGRELSDLKYQLEIKSCREDIPGSCVVVLILNCLMYLHCLFVACTVVCNSKLYFLNDG